MASRPPRTDLDGEREGKPPNDSFTGMPTWVKVFLAIALLVIVSFIIMVVSGGGGNHGPGRHSYSDQEMFVAAAVGR